MKKENRGGPGRNQGRHKLNDNEKRISKTFRISKKTVEILESQPESQGVIIDKAVKLFFENKE